MADYSERATQLSGPSTEGAYTKQVGGPAPTVPPLVEGLVNIFVRGLKDPNAAKAAADARKNNVISGYVQAETTLNDAVATGQITPIEAAARSRANFNKYAAGHSEYIEDFEKAGKALRGFSETGEVQKQVKRQEDVRNADIDEARKSGFVFLPGMGPDAENDQIIAHKSRLIADQQMEKMYKQNAEARAQGTYDQNVADKQQKDLSFQLINSIAGDNLQAFGSFSTTLRDDVKSGKMTPETAQATLNERFSNVSAAIQAAARTNPELAAPYRSLFNDMNKVAQDMLDPKKQSEGLEEQLKVIKTRMKLVAMGDTKIAAAVVANELLPNNPSLALASSSEGIRAMTLLGANPVSTAPGGQYIPQVVGNPEVEGDVIKMLKGGLSSLKSDKIPEKAIAEVQAANTVNQMLKQTGELVNRGATPEQLKGVAGFFASPEYAGFVTNGKIDKEAAGTAYKTFQLLYEPTIVKGVQQRLNDLSRKDSSFGSKQAAPVPVTQLVDVQFSGSGIVFKPKGDFSREPMMRISQAEIVRDMSTAQKAINQLIHIGAHMEGSTDYGKYWEANKHVYLPSMFPDPKLLKAGDVKDGYKYLGGNANDPRSWQPQGE